MSAKGSITTTDPFPAEVIPIIKANLEGNLRELTLFCLGVNAALRASDILNLTRDAITEGEDGELILFIREGKTQKLRRVFLNRPTSDVLRRYVASLKYNRECIFDTNRGRPSVSWFIYKCKAWAQEAGVTGRIATHSLRKSWGCAQYRSGRRLGDIMMQLNHWSERTTAVYCGLDEEHLRDMYKLVV